MQAIGIHFTTSARVNVFADKYGTIYAIVLPINVFFLVSMVVSSFLFIYFSNYVVASYIQVMALYLKLPECSSATDVTLMTTQQNRLLFLNIALN